MRILSFALEQKQIRALLFYCFSNAQNNSYAKTVYFEVTYIAMLQNNKERKRVGRISVHGSESQA